MERYNCKNRKHHKDKKNRVGIIFLVIGLVLLGKNLHLFPTHSYPLIFSWQMLLVVIGVISILFNRRHASGLVMIAIGGLFLLDKINPLSQAQWQIAWPGLFIIVGLLLVFGYLIKPDEPKEKPKPKIHTNHDDVEFDIDKIEPIES